MACLSPTSISIPILYKVCTFVPLSLFWLHTQPLMKGIKTQNWVQSLITHFHQRLLKWNNANVPLTDLFCLSTPIHLFTHIIPQCTCHNRYIWCSTACSVGLWKHQPPLHLQHTSDTTSSPQSRGGSGHWTMVRHVLCYCQKCIQFNTYSLMVIRIVANSRIVYHYLKKKEKLESCQMGHFRTFSRTILFRSFPF